MYHFIINPSSSSNKGILQWKEIKAKLIQENVEFESYITSHSHNATEIAREITTIETTKKNIIVILGGDGTLNEVINGITSFKNLIIGYIPTGSSNDFARALKLKTKPLEALECILHPKAYKKIDCGVLKTDQGTRNFIVSSGIGYDASVCEESMTSSAKTLLNKLKLGKLTYTALGISMLFSYTPEDATIILDNSITIHLKNMLFTSIHNNRYEGGGLLFCPKADNSDGLLDICVAQNISKVKFLSALPFAFMGKHTLFKGIDTYRCKTIEVQTLTPRPVHTDGETVERQTKISATCGKEQINIIIG